MTASSCSLRVALFVWLSFARACTVYGAEYSICEDGSVPLAAMEIGAVWPLFRDCPQLAYLDFTGHTDNCKYYGGVWFGKPKGEIFFEAADDGLIIKRGGALTTVKMSSHPGFFPLMSGAKPFYIEVQAAISSNDRDNFPAIWLMPIEHNLRLDDVYSPDPSGFERWFELDIDEGGFGPGGHHTAISWWGKWPNYQKLQNPKPTSKEPLDRTRPNVFGVSYDPRTLTVRWWLNGRKVLEVGPPYVPDVARLQNFYLIVSAQSHRNISDYQLKFMGVRAFVGDSDDVENSR